VACHGGPWPAPPRVREPVRLDKTQKTAYSPPHEKEHIPWKTARIKISSLQLVKQDVVSRRIELVDLMSRINALDEGAPPVPEAFPLMRRYSALWHGNSHMLTATFSGQQEAEARKMFDYCREALLVRSRRN
jgi:hypothetical protein